MEILRELIGCALNNVVIYNKYLLERYFIKNHIKLFKIVYIILNTLKVEYKIEERKYVM